MAMTFGQIPIATAQQAQAGGQNQWASNVIQTINKIGGSLGQAQAQQAQQLQAMILQSQMQPQMVPARFFPQCPTGPGVASIPDNICRSVPVPGDNGSLMQARMFRSIAIENMSFYEKHLAAGQNSHTPVGLQCIEDNIKRTSSTFDDKMNTIQDLANRVKKETQTFREQNKQLLENMHNLNSELNGTARTQDASQVGQIRQMKDLFPNHCKDIIADSDFTKFQRDGGLLGLRNDSLGPFNDVATKAVNNKSVYEKDLNTYIQKLRSEIETQGLEGQINPDMIGLTNFGTAQAVVEREIGIAQREIGQIRTKMKAELDYDIPTLDSAFSASDFDNFKTNATQFFKKKAINECVTMSDKGIGLSTEQILSGLRQDGVSTNINLNRYRQALSGVLGSDNAYIQDKLNQIRALDQQYGNSITLAYRDSTGANVQQTPYELLMQTVQMCETRISQTDIFSPTNSSGGSLSTSISEAQKIEKGKKYLDRIAEINKTLAANLANRLYDEVANCSGRQLKAGSCTQNTLAPGSNNFCIAHSTNCAQQVMSCHAVAQNLIKERETKLNSNAVTYNANVATLVARQEALLNLVKTQVIQDADFIKRFLPGASFQLPEDLFVKMPEPEMSAFGINLRGGGRLDSIENLPEQILKMKEMVNKQKEQVIALLQEYKSGQEEALASNMEKWATLKDKCDQVEVKYAEAVAAANQAGAKANAESQAVVGDFCNRFERLRRNPAAGCSEAFDIEGLYESSVKASGMVSNAAREYVADFSSYCAQSQSEATLGTEGLEDEDAQKRFLELACSGNSSEAIDEISKKLSSIIPVNSNGEDKISEDEIKSILKMSKSDARAKLKAEGITSGPLYNIIEKITQDNESTPAEDIEKLLARAAVAPATTAPYADYLGSSKTKFTNKLKEIGFKLDASNKIIADGSEPLFCENIKLTALFEAMDSGSNSASAPTPSTVFGSSSNSYKKKLEEKFQDRQYTDVGRAIASAIEKESGSAGGVAATRMGQQGEDITCLANSNNQRGSLGDIASQIQAFDNSVLGVGR
jgi:hypothetical protein